MCTQALCDITMVLRCCLFFREALNVGLTTLLCVACFHIKSNCVKKQCSAFKQIHQGSLFRLRVAIPRGGTQINCHVHSFFFSVKNKSLQPLQPQSYAGDLHTILASSALVCVYVCACVLARACFVCEPHGAFYRRCLSIRLTESLAVAQNHFVPCEKLFKGIR